MIEVEGTYDAETRTVYLYFVADGEVSRSATLAGSTVILDYDAEGKLLGMEVLLGREE